MLEGKKIEFKREYTDKIKYTIVAFANTDGGDLYVGINDDGSICGVENSDDTMLQLTNVIRDTIKPDVTMFTEVDTVETEGKKVVRVTVQRGTARPYYLAAKGIRPEGVFVRQGASSVSAAEGQILSMIKETSGDCYEEERSINQDLTFQKTAEYFQKKGVDFGDPQKRTLNIIGKDGTYTNLGLLLSDQCPHTIKLAVYKGVEKWEFQDRKEVTGSLLQQAEEAYEYINRYNTLSAVFDGLDRLDKWAYPKEAIRETLLNAIVHREYSISGPILISIFEDRIEFVSPGGLTTNMEYDDLMLGLSVLRNKNLANIFYRLQLIESYGTGILKIKKSYKEEKKQPEIKTASNSFKVILPNLSVKDMFGIEEASNIDKTDNTVGANDQTLLEDIIESKTSIDERRLATIVLFVKEAGVVSRKEIDEKLGISQSTSSLLLRKLVEAGLLKKEGNGRSTRYIINKQ